MKRIIIYGLLPLTAVACTKTIYETAPTTTTKQTTQTIPATPAPVPTLPYRYDPEREYIRAVYAGFDDIIYLSDNELLESGYTTCEAIANGVPRYMIVQTMINASDGSSEMQNLLAAVAAGATSYLCPEYSNFWSD